MNTNSEDSRADYFDTVREQLRYWPYVIHQIDDTLDARLIEGRGKQLLFRAIHANNLTAFAGSGLSMSFGRLSWREWEAEQKRSVERNANNFCDLAEKALNWIKALELIVDPKGRYATDPQWKDLDALWKLVHKDKSEILIQPQRHNIWQWLRGRQRAIEYARRQITRLKETFALAQASGGHFPGGEEMPVKFEIAQQLHNQLRVYAAIFLELDPNTANETAPENVWWPGARIDRSTDAPFEALNQIGTKLWKEASICGPAKKKLRETFKTYARSFKRLEQAYSRPEANLDFEGLAKALLVDECPHAMLLLRNGLAKSLDPEGDEPTEQPGIRKWKDTLNTVAKLERETGVFDPKYHRRDIEGIREAPERYRILTPFQFDTFQILRSNLIDEIKRGEKDNPATEWRSDWLPALNWLDSELKEYVKKTKLSGDTRVYLTPSSRFFVSFCLALFDDPVEALDLKEKDRITSRFFAEPSRKNLTSRRSIISKRFDPLAKINGKLGIRRFVTTNYDFEIERFFQDNGQRHFPPRDQFHPGGGGANSSLDRDAFRVDNLGTRLEDQCFRPERAAELTAFALKDEDGRSSVFHLHGRAAQEDGLVITERDYMNLYLTEDEHRATIDEGIGIVFSGAPLLFLGLGMEETDLLRPLRQFISNRDRTIGYTSIALLPADRGIEARTKFAASLYLRYGIHTVFYGGGAVDYMGKDLGIDWLYRIVRLVEGLRNEVNRWIDAPQTGRESHEIVADLDSMVGTLGTDLGDFTPRGADMSAFKILFHFPNTYTAKGMTRRLLQSQRNSLTGRLRDCTFTPTRPRDNSANPHRDEAEANVDGGTYLKFYTRLLDHITTQVVRLPAGGGGLNKARDKAERKARLTPLLIALNGLQSAFITGSLNAALEGIAAEKEAWWRAWQDGPPPRLPEPQRLDIPGGRRDPARIGTVYVRHRVDNVITGLERYNGQTHTHPLLDGPDDENEPVRLSAPNRTHVRAFDTFVAAMATTFGTRHMQGASERQLITVAARRGMGKGSFMSAFSSDLGQDTYKAAAWPDANVFFAGSIFINIGFSTEVASCYDMISSALINTIAALHAETKERVQGEDRIEPYFDDEEPSDPPEPEAQMERRQEITCLQLNERKRLRKVYEPLSRLSELRGLFDEFTKSATAYRDKFDQQPRLLLNLCTVDLLFDRNNIPKNGEIDRVIELLFSEDLRHCPMDVLFLADDHRLGAPWSDLTSNQFRLRLDRGNLDPLAEERIQRAMVTSRIVIDEDDASRQTRMALTGLKIAPGPRENHFVHFTRPVNGVWLLIDNFPVLATAFHLLNPPGKTPEARADEKRSAEFKDLCEAFREAVQKGRDESDKKMKEIWSAKDLPDKDTLKNARGKVWEITETAIRDGLKAQTERVYTTKKQKELTDKIPLILRERLRSEHGSEDADEWRKTRRYLGSNRFTLTVLLALAEHVVIHADDALEGAAEAQRLIRDTVSKVRNVGSEQRDKMVLETVIETYRRYHVIGDADLDNEFHLLILRHLGAIATPLGSAVLVRLSEFRQYFERVGIELETSRRRHLVRALTVLAYRGLVFRQDPHPHLVRANKDRTDEDWPAHLEFRYALHRVVQNYAMANLRAGLVEPVMKNTFSPSLYVAMNSSGERLSRATHRFLRALLIGLSQYPDVPTTDISAEPWLFTTRDTNVKVQAVRAALSLARSTFSVATVACMADQPTLSQGIQKRGHLETYRVRLRWLIRVAWELKHEKSEAERWAETHRSDPENPPKSDRFNVFYRDEIVWIYNELGVISLAQGSLSDALGYLRHAAQENEGIEGRSRNTPIFNHIDLNHGIVQIERGSFDSARNRLDRVIAATRERSQRVHWAATGYRTLLSHLTGDRQGLDKSFEDTTAFFQENNDPRAAAVFLMHHARFIASDDHARATRLLVRARDLATTAGHEDIRHHIELAAIKVQRMDANAPESTLGTLNTLQTVETYGRNMAIWSLQADALCLRASVLKEQGETATAGRMLIRAMAITRRHAMNLRLNNAMTLYASNLLQRGDVKGATLIATASLERAKKTGYSLETERCQAVLKICGLTAEA